MGPVHHRGLSEGAQGYAHLLYTVRVGYRQLWSFPSAEVKPSPLMT
jgi:hypothetical protein